MPEGRFTTKAPRREPERWREAGQKAGWKEWQEAKGASPSRTPEPEGGRRVERKREAQATSGNQPESEVHGLAARPTEDDIEVPRQSGSRKAEA